MKALIFVGLVLIVMVLLIVSLRTKKRPATAPHSHDQHSPHLEEQPTPTIPEGESSSVSCHADDDEEPKYDLSTDIPCGRKYGTYYG